MNEIDTRGYERLVLATGTEMVLPPIQGIQTPGVYTIQKSMSAMKSLRAKTVALAIQKGVSVRELDMMQIATHPMLTSAPTVHPLINAAHMALGKLRQQIV